MGLLVGRLMLLLLLLLWVAHNGRGRIHGGMRGASLVGARGKQVGITLLGILLHASLMLHVSLQYVRRTGTKRKRRERSQIIKRDRT